MTDNHPSRVSPPEKPLGKFGHHPDPATDFEVEVEEIESIITDVRLGLRPKDDIEPRLSNAMKFRVGGVPSAVAAKDTLRALQDSLMSPTSQPQGGWRTMESAPKDGTFVWLCKTQWNGSAYFYIHLAYWRDEDPRWVPAHFNDTQAIRDKLMAERTAPTHWMPLQTVPKPLPEGAA